MTDYVSLATSIGGDLPVLFPVYAIGDLPAASTDLTGACVVVTGTGHATTTTQLAVCNGTTWKYASDGITTVSA